MRITIVREPAPPPVPLPIKEVVLHLSQEEATRLLRISKVYYRFNEDIGEGILIDLYWALRSALGKGESRGEG